MDPDVSMETNKARLLAMEQKYLKWGFSLPKELFYNFLPTAGSSLGFKHTEETLAKISGPNNHMYGKIPASPFQSGPLNPIYGKVSANALLPAPSGANNPLYGKVPTHAITVNVYSIDNLLVRSFTSQVAAANWLKIPRSTFQGYLSSGKVWNNQYIFLKSIIS